MSFTGNNGFGQFCGSPAYGFQNTQFNRNGAGIRPNGHGPANNKGGRKKGNNRRGMQHPADRNNDSNKGQQGRRTPRSQNQVYDQPQNQNQNQNPNGSRRTANVPARGGRKNNRRFSPIPVNNQGFPSGPSGRRAKASPWDGDIMMHDAPRIKKPGRRSIQDVAMVDAPAVVMQQPIWEEDRDMAMQDAPPLPEEQPVYQYQFDLERHFLLAFEQLALERQQGRELLAQGLLEMQRLAASMLHLAPPVQPQSLTWARSIDNDDNKNWEQQIDTDYKTTTSFDNNNANDKRINERNGYIFLSAWCRHRVTAGSDYDLRPPN
ncbi:hypothetical protein SI65_04483 [Aspergillus cristatus]|uniref:Uncharacterized protein n=1 Tax=Aspergillus cristatus TaxID=573508 RepID=A0A1E3BEY6_ASPCR|nr:hypothetical protein SI65_04483 [Aspergillus cristatus]